MDNLKVSFLVLDYKKPEEAYNCLKSIRDNVSFNYQIIYQDNGSNDKYPLDFYNSGLCDVLISRKKGKGGGFGQTDLFRYCDTEYAFFVQSDQFLRAKLDDSHLAYLVSLIENGYHCVDLNGDQSNRGVWTDRAHFINVNFFNSLGPFPNGGPGMDHLPWNEKHLQDKFEHNKYQIAHIKPAIFADNGVFTIRQGPDGSILKMRTDTKQLWWIKNPTQKYIFPELYDDEWELSFSGKWIGGTTPRKYIENNSVFNCWGDRNA